MANHTLFAGVMPDMTDDVSMRVASPAVLSRLSAFLVCAVVASTMSPPRPWLRSG